SVLERLSMPSDPELLQFGGSIAQLDEAWQWRTGLRDRVGHKFVPLQHLNLVLHFVRELRESIVPPARHAGVIPWSSPRRTQFFLPVLPVSSSAAGRAGGESTYLPSFPLRPHTSFASSVISAFSTFDTGQFFSASSAICANAAGSMPGIF